MVPPLARDGRRHGRPGTTRALTEVGGRSKVPLSSTFIRNTLGGGPGMTLRLGDFAPDFAADFWVVDLAETQGHVPCLPTVADPERKVANLFGMMGPARDEVSYLRLTPSPDR
jgi:hypothetical protein